MGKRRRSNLGRKTRCAQYKSDHRKMEAEMEEEKNGEILYLLHGKNTWECEQDLRSSYVPIVESYLTSNSCIEIIKLDKEMDKTSYHDNYLLKTVDIGNEKLKQDDSNLYDDGKGFANVYYPLKEESTNSFESHPGCDKGVKLSASVTKCFTCDICCITFPLKSSLKKHSIIHVSKKPFDCDRCWKKFARKDYLLHHKLIAHDGEKPFPCDMCEKKFAWKSNLNTHKLTHDGAKPFSCDICEKKFAQKSQLNGHKLFHTGEKPFPCEICEKRFSLKQNWKRHSIIHSNVKPFACDMCEKTFKRKAHLNRHILTHSGIISYSCDICYETFSFKYELRKHMEIPCGENVGYVTMVTDI